MLADDTYLVYMGDDLADLVLNVNRDLKNVYYWCKFNKLSLNPFKSEFMLVTHKRVDTMPEIFIGDDLVTHEENLKYLGLCIDNKLKFQCHIDHGRSKLVQFSGMSYRLKHFLNRTAANNLFYGCIYSVMKYFIVVWGGVLQCSQSTWYVPSIFAEKNSL